jgi:hypothetical protein
MTITKITYRKIKYYSSKINPNHIILGMKDIVRDRKP